MTKEEQLRCLTLVRHYHLYRGRTRIATRNELYSLLRIPLIKWIRSILKEWNLRQTEQEILSLTWDCFERGLNQYRKYDVPLPFHFYRYSRYVLYQLFIQNNRKEVPLMAEKEVLIPDLSIKEIYDRLPERSRIILMDLIGHQSTNKTKGNYYQHKRIIKKYLSTLY